MSTRAVSPVSPVGVRAFEAARIVVIGCVGSGKSTLAAAVAERLDAPHIRRDWLGLEGSEAYRAAAARAVSGRRWVFDGAPYYVEDLVYGRANLIVGFDLRRHVVMRRVLARSVRESLGLVPVPPHRSRRWHTWLDPEQPLRWAWSTWADRHRELTDVCQRGLAPQATFVRLSTPAGAKAWLARKENSGWSAWPHTADGPAAAAPSGSRT